MKKILLSTILFLGLSVQSSFAYYTGMSANTVVGQDNFLASSGGFAQNKLGGLSRGMFVDSNGRLIVSDQSNHRILIWNRIPDTNGVPADLVLGQADFTGHLANRGGSRAANSLNTPDGVYSDGTKLFVVDEFNDRVLLWNTFPTQNGQSADLALVGSLTASSNTCDSSHVSAPTGIAVFGGKAIVTDRNHHRALIWNTIPTTSGVAADVVLGEVDSTTCSVPTTSATSLNSPRLTYVDENGKLYIVDATASHRVLIWNSIPTANNTPANVVVGQPDFTSNSAKTTADGLSTPIGVFARSGRMYIADNGNARVLIYNSIPSTNGASADIVLGQSNFTSAASNAGGSTSAFGLNSGQTLFEYNGRLLVTDSGSARVLIFNNDVLPPALSLSSVPEGRGGDLLRMSGNANTSDQYVIKNVEYSINGNSFTGAVPTDGSFASKSEDYYFDFNPKTNQPKDTLGNLIDGYTLRVRSVNNNADTKDNLFYFSPFEVLSPANHAVESGSMPTFTFKVNKNRSLLFENLSKYQIQTKRLSDSSWSTYIESIPIDFASVKGNQDNIQREIWRSQNTNNGTYETSGYSAKYSDESSTIQIQSKTNSLSGSYQWKVVAVDKSGHTQDTGIRDLTVGSTLRTTNTLPIALLSISGISNSKVQSLASMSLTTNSLTPTFYGIAWGGSQIILRMTSGSETKTYTTVANMSSRFGINIPKGDLSKGKIYTVTVSTSLGDKYGEIYPFMLKIL